MHLQTTTQRTNLAVCNDAALSRFEVKNALAEYSMGLDRCRLEALQAFFVFFEIHILQEKCKRVFFYRTSNISLRKFQIKSVLMGIIQCKLLDTYADG